MVGFKTVILERRTKNPSKTLLPATQNLFLSLYSSFLPYQTLGVSRDLVYPKSLLTGLGVNEPESMVIVWVIFSTSSADPFWEGSRASIRPMFFKSGVSRTLRQLPLQLQWPTSLLSKLLVSQCWALMLALDRCEFKGKANRKQKPTLCLSTRQRVLTSFPEREI